MLLAVALLVLVLAVLVGVAGIVATISLNQRRTDEQNRVVPEVPTRAPAAWLRSNSTEAKLHRRLRDAVRALRTVPGLDGFVLERRAEVERAALLLDDQLVVIASLPPAQRAAPLAEVAGYVDELEAGVAALATRPLGDGGAVTAALRELDQALAHLADARAELDDLERGPFPPPGELWAALEQLRQEQEEAAGPSARPPGPPERPETDPPQAATS